MTLQSKIAILKELALDFGFTMNQEGIGSAVRLTFLDNGKVGLDMELTNADSIVPFARLNQYSDESFAEFALQLLGKEFSE